MTIKSQYIRQHDLTQWVNGYGNIPHIYPKDGEHGYVTISAYLQEIVPQIEKRLYKEAKQSEDDSSLPVSNTGNPMIRINECPLMGSTYPYTSTRARPNGMPDPLPLGNG
ncbi:hypothetical protein VP01_8252g1 [Puccinia sorghi]|uniref:Uncharacterized protein n=1 Tax=Puccinia sorghi TaxID=27349 RepID=A0A0L6UBZ1_9BASI|nr:hypothetical protein VP01_8252g1 [Puccinia sorghi]